MGTSKISPVSFSAEQMISFEKMLSRRSSNLNLIGRISELEDSLACNKLHMNMVIHDLRNPAESIQQGLKQAQEKMKLKMSAIMKHAYKTLEKQLSILDRTGSLSLPSQALK